VRVLLDTSCVNYFERLQEGAREKILLAFRSGRPVAELCWETIQEVLAVAGTGKEVRLPGRASLLLRVTRNHEWRLQPRRRSKRRIGVRWETGGW
jgi:hypothetical protein